MAFGKEETVSIPALIKKIDTIVNEFDGDIKSVEKSHDSFKMKILFGHQFDLEDAHKEIYQYQLYLKKGHWELTPDTKKNSITVSFSLGKENKKAPRVEQPKPQKKKPPKMSVKEALHIVKNMISKYEATIKKEEVNTGGFILEVHFKSWQATDQFDTALVDIIPKIGGQILIDVISDYDTRLTYNH